MALNSKRTQTFFNEFLITTTQFLNQFMTDCENKFFEFERKLNRIESNLVIIEAKLASVPDEHPQTQSSITQSTPQPPEQALPSSAEPSKPQEDPIKPDAQPPAQEEPPQPSPSAENSNMIKISESYHYKKFFKMVKFGVPPPAVKTKMLSEGLDGNLLDTPELMIEKIPEDDMEEEE